MDSVELPYSRRRFLTGALYAGGAVVIAACTQGGALQTLTASPATTPRPSPLGTPSVTFPNPTPDGAATVLVRDVLDFHLRGPFEWNGGRVTMRLHEGRIDGDPIYFVRMRHLWSCRLL